MSGASGHRPITVAVDRAAAASIPEISYVFRTLLRTAGYPWRLQWAEDTDGPVDIAYGDGARARATVHIPLAPWPMSNAPSLEPDGVVRHDGLTIPRFPGETVQAAAAGQRVAFPSDIVFACYWWLTGARERTYRRDRVDNLHLDEGATLRREGLLASPCVSLTADFLRRVFQSSGIEPRAPSWLAGGHEAAFCLTHDVDYPEIIRWIEAPRVLASRGLGGLPLAMDVATGRSHFWTFREWVDLARDRGSFPAFYFMARRGSLLQYALGTPDDFYDIASPRFQRLFAELRDRGCEVGLHASFHAHRSVDQLRHEREKLETLAGVRGIGNRHHYWHLDPDDPNETLRRHEAAGLSYDSSLGLEYYPGFRRGICHPFRVFHPGERRELDIVQLPPSWMDDHFDRRLANNGITDPVAVARNLVDVARKTGGAVVVDYHSRGMNEQFYPRYGPWFSRFLSDHVGANVKFLTPREVVAAYREQDAKLTAASVDRLTR